MTDRIASVVLALAALAATPVHAQEREEERRAEAEAPGVWPEGDFRLRWPYPRFRPVEYVITFGTPVLFRLIDHNTRDATEPRWTGGNFFDDGVESLVGNNHDDTRELAARISDVTWYSSMAYPFLDTLIVVLIADGNPDVAWQMMALNVQSMAVNGFVTLLSIRAVARTRPDREQCLRESADPASCPPGDRRSFPSGHTSGSFTGAGLACAHHMALPLYGGGAADAAACVAALVVASGTAVTRVISDRHHASDVLVGAGIGLASGWLLPWLLHYQLADYPEDEPRGGVALLPFGDGRTSGGIAAIGRW